MSDDSIAGEHEGSRNSMIYLFMAVCESSTTEK